MGLILESLETSACGKESVEEFADRLVMSLQGSGNLGNTEAQVAEAYHFQPQTKAWGQIGQQGQTVKFLTLVLAKFNSKLLRQGLIPPACILRYFSVKVLSRIAMLSCRRRRL